MLVEELSFLRLFCRMQNRSLVSGREFTRLVDWSVGRSLGCKLLFVFPLTNAQLDLTKRKMSNGSANVKHSEAMSDEIVTAMSTARGASIFVFEFLKKPRNHLLASWGKETTRRREKRKEKKIVCLQPRDSNSRPSRFPSFQMQYTPTH